MRWWEESLTWLGLAVTVAMFTLLAALMAVKVEKRAEARKSLVCIVRMDLRVGGGVLFVRNILGYLEPR